MATSDPIKGTDIIEDGALTPAIQQAKDYLELLRQIQATLKGQLKSSADNVRSSQLSGDTESIKAHTDAVNKNKQAIQGLNDTKKLEIEAQAKINQQIKEYRNEVKQKNILDKAAADSDAAKSIQLAKLIDQYKNASQATKGQFVPAIQKLTLELNSSEQATGRFTRAVGDYHDNTIKYAKGLRGLGGIGRLAARVFGFDSESFIMIQEAGRALKEYHHTQEALKVATEANTAATEAETAARQQAVYVAEAHEAEVAGDTTAVEYNTVATEENTVAIEEENAVKAIGVGGWTLIAAAIVAASIALYEWLKGSKDSIESWANNNKTIKEFREEVKKLNEEIGKSEIELLKRSHAITDYQAAQALARQKELKDVGEVSKKVREETKKIEEDEGGFFINIWRTIKSISTGGGLYGGILESAEIATEKIKKLHDEAEKFLDTEEKAANVALELTRKLPAVGREDAFDTDQERLELAKIQTTNIKKQLDIQREIDLRANEHNVKDLEIREIKRLEIETKYQHDLDELTKGDNGKLIKVHTLKAKLEDEDYKLRQKRLKEERELLKQEADAVLEFYKNTLARKNKLTETQLNNDLDMRQRNIEQQQQLANEGRANTLAFEKAAAAKDELEKQKLAEKEKKQSDAIELGKIFLKIYFAYAEKDPDGAALKAMKNTFVAKGLASSISGSYFEGTENVAKDLRGNPNVRDGYVVAVDGSERILTGAQNSLVGNMSNEDLAKLAYNYQMGLPSGVIPAFVESGNSDLLNEFKSFKDEVKQLKQILQDRPVSTTNIHKDGTVSKEQLTNGLTKAIHYKPSNNNYI